jgi:hypothetical protein
MTVTVYIYADLSKSTKIINTIIRKNVGSLRDENMRVCRELSKQGLRNCAVTHIWLVIEMAL